MARERWFDGVECAGCGFPLLFHEDTSGGRSIYSPAAPLVIRCTNPACRREEDYYGRTHKKCQTAVDALQNGSSLTPQYSGPRGFAVLAPRPLTASVRRIE